MKMEMSTSSRSNDEQTKFIKTTTTKTKGLGRRISFSSAGLGMGTFPKEANVCEPTINVALYFETCPSVQALEEVASKILEYERCSGIPVGTDGKNDWHFQQLSDIPVSKLVRTFQASGDEAIHALIEEHVNTDDLRNTMTTNTNTMVERDGLPWFELVRFVNTGKGKSAVVLRIDHTIGDGVAVVNIFENVATYADGTLMKELIPSSMSKKFQKKRSFWAGVVVMFFKLIVSFFRVLTLAATKFDDDYTFRRCVQKDMTYSGSRKQIIFPEIPLDFVKSLKNAQEVRGDKTTINDVMFAAVSQMLHDYSKAHNDPTLQKGAKLQSRVLMPVALPRPAVVNEINRTTSLSNRWVLLSVDIGVGITGAVERLKTITATTSKLKNSPIALVQNFVQSKVAPLLPVTVTRQTVYDTFIRHSMVLTNVPGPKKPAEFGGEEVDSCQLFFCNLIPNFNVLSYSGNIYCCLSIDSDAIPDAESLPAHFINAFLTLAKELHIDVPKSLATSQDGAK